MTAHRTTLFSISLILLTLVWGTDNEPSITLLATNIEVSYWFALLVLSVVILVNGVSYYLRADIEMSAAKLRAERSFKKSSSTVKKMVSTAKHHGQEEEAKKILSDASLEKYVEFKEYERRELFDFKIPIGLAGVALASAMYKVALEFYCVFFQ